ncbi:hypothetical protein G647_08334 [Cladophialophora carrionii CBS 160.54]|uniref:NmrA-like domain-containing protein n=1 Tax=Cladophialophora carrionii CBS 160.54 TaxID=1279043 RepID=V9D070_9EURO|nr:uncharacterized protein G647_08334 [Cladophialophora carrionii CBS 160.54]ETI20300.1 hypothetical protein G647_08334 [Cladophialophora carrionii CBS 160.54]
MSKLIVVLGATGTQGGSVVDTFLGQSGWKIRALSRNANGAAAQKLKEKGVHEVVTATLDEVASLTEAFKGAHTVFSVTDFWGLYRDPSNTEKAAATGLPKNVWAARVEEQQGKNVFDAAAHTAGLERLVFSGLSHATKWSRGKYSHVYHFDAKARAAEYGREKHVELWAKTSILQVGFYLSNLSTSPFMRPRKDENGVYVLPHNFPMAVKLPLIATEEDTGPFTRALVEVAPGKNLIAYRAWMTLDEYLDIIRRVTGVKAVSKQVPLDASSGSIPEELVAELTDNANYFEEFGYEGRDDPTLVHPKDLGVDVQLPSVEDWVKKQDWSSVFT